MAPQTCCILCAGEAVGLTNSTSMDTIYGPFTAAVQHKKIPTLRMNKSCTEQPLTPPSQLQCCKLCVLFHHHFVKTAKAQSGFLLGLLVMHE